MTKNECRIQIERRWNVFSKLVYLQHTIEIIFDIIAEILPIFENKVGKSFQNCATDNGEDYLLRMNPKIPTLELFLYALSIKE